MTRRCTSPESLPPYRLAGSGCGDDDDTVVVAVGDVARHECHPAEADRYVSLTRAGLAERAGIGAERLDAEVDAAQGDIPNGTVHDQPGPAVGVRQLGDDVADQRGVQRAGAIDHQHAAVAGRRQHRLQQRVVLEAAHRGDRPGELCAHAELAELNVTATYVGPDI